MITSKYTNQFNGKGNHGLNSPEIYKPFVLAKAKADWLNRQMLVDQ